MQRRTLLRLGIGSAVLLALAGGGAQLLRPGLQQGRLGAPAREVLHAVARAVLDGSLPEDAAMREAALQAQVDRVEALIMGLPAATQRELSQLLGLLGTAAGRMALAGLTAPWTQASVAQLQQALEALRQSKLSLRRQAYHGLRDLTNAAFYAVPGHWALMGYPEPTEL